MSEKSIADTQAFVDAVAHYALLAAGREQGALCENCGKPVEVGQVVLAWDDVGEMHADCEKPFSLKVEQQADEPEPCVLLGSPMRLFRVSALLAAANTPKAAPHDQ